MQQPPSGSNAGNANDPKKVSIIGKVAVEYTAPTSIQDISHAIREQTAAQRNAGNGAGNISEKGLEQQKRANSISRLSLWISGCALVAALFAVVLNYKALRATTDANSLTKVALSRDSARYIETNHALILIDTIKDISAQGQAIFQFTFLNWGTFPAQFTGAAMGVSFKNFSYSDSRKISDQLNFYDDLNNIILPHERVFKFDMDGNKINPRLRDSVNKRLLYMFFEGSIYYRDITTKKEYEYDFKIRVNSGVWERRGLYHLVDTTIDFHPR